MPLYEYRPVEGDCPHCRGGFEVLQPVSDTPLEKCPECGQACRRVFSTFAAVKSARDMLSTKNLASKGFTQYKRAGDGHYERTCGEGPQVISRDDV
ncbi:MAG: zinc ribbon domain-containing protein [Pirellulales bacterium]|nr:zinc ribbon domain-containing protein [Pirellulales bacterium]